MLITDLVELSIKSVIGVAMDEIKRDIYLNRLIERKENGSIKVITGIRAAGNPFFCSLCTATIS
jgi:predicted AAA+ superfamily ATPase